MRRWLNLFLALVMTVLCSMSMVLPAYAAEQPGVSVPVTISLSGSLPSRPESFTVVLKADGADYPMPEGAVNGAYAMTITGEDTENLPAITFDRVGVYSYKIYQVAGTNKKCKYDGTVYALTVTISNKEDFSGLEATAVLSVDSEGEKLTGAEFANKYKVEPPSDTPKTGDESTPLLYAVLIVISMVVMAALFLTRKSTKMEE